MLVCWWRGTHRCMDGRGREGTARFLCLPLRMWPGESSLVRGVECAGRYWGWEWRERVSDSCTPLPFADCAVQLFSPPWLEWTESLLEFVRTKGLLARETGNLGGTWSTSEFEDAILYCRVQYRSPPPSPARPRPSVVQARVYSSLTSITTTSASNPLPLTSPTSPTSLLTSY